MTPRWRPRCALFITIALISGCRRPASDDGAPRPTPTPHAPARPAPKRPAAPDPDALPAAADLPPEKRAIQVVADEERVVDADVARARGLTLVDLGDAWAPAIFDDGKAADGGVLPNRYRVIFT